MSTMKELTDILQNSISINYGREQLSVRSMYSVCWIDDRPIPRAI